MGLGLTEVACQDSIFTLASLLENRLLSKRDTFACFIDLRKAFDCINRDLLWQKLEQRYRIGGHFLAALKSLYERVDCAVNINHSLSNWFEVGCGVKQGCILSPTLFALFVDDLVQALNDEEKGVVFGDSMLTALLYADDI